MNEKPHQHFTDLTVWTKSRELKKEIFELVRKFPAEEKYKLTDQLIRASRSITACIAEGHGRYTYKNQLHYCIMARGSLSETHNHLIDAFDCKYITEEVLKLYKNKVDEIGRLLNGYITYLRKNINTVA